MSLVLNIQNICKKNNISIHMLEAELEFGQGAIYKWDTNSPSVERLQKVAEYFNVTIDSLVPKSKDKSTKLANKKTIKDIQFPFRCGGVEGLTKKEIDVLAQIAKMLKEQRTLS
jgi:transcriptional regulator with XRE-family HTH domain